MSEIINKNQYINRIVNLESTVIVITISSLLFAVGSIYTFFSNYNDTINNYNYYFGSDIETIEGGSIVSFIALLYLASIITFIILVIIYQYSLYSIIKNLYKESDLKSKNFLYLAIPLFGPYFAYFIFKKFASEIKNNTGDILEDDRSWSPDSIFNFSRIKSSLLFYSIYPLSPVLIVVLLPLISNSRVEEMYVDEAALLYGIVYSSFMAISMIIAAFYLKEFNARLSEVLLEKVKHDDSIPDAPKNVLTTTKPQSQQFNEYVSKVKNKITNTSSEDFIDKLNKLEILYKNGSLTEEEYSQAKQKIINSN